MVWFGFEVLEVGFRALPLLTERMLYDWGSPQQHGLQDSQYLFTLCYPLSALFVFCLAVFLRQKFLYVSLAVLEFTSTHLYLLSPGITNYLTLFS